MIQRRGKFRKYSSFLPVACGFILVFVAQYFFRSSDDNRLAGLESAFRFVSPQNVLFFLAAGVLTAFIISRITSIASRPALFLFASSYSLSILFWGEPELILDASRYFSQAKYLELYGFGYFFREWGREIFAWTDMPVVPLIYGSIFRLFGESRPGIQIVSTFFFSMTPVLTYLLGKRLWDEETGFTGGMLLLGIPYLFSQVPLMLVDVPLMFFFMLSVYAFILAVELAGIWIGVAALSLCLTFFIKYSSALMLTELLVILGVYSILPVLNRETAEKVRAKEVLIRGGTVFMISGLLVGLIFMAKSDVFLTQIKLLLDYQKPGLERWGESFVSTFLFQAHPGLCLAGIFSIVVAIKKRDIKYIIVLWLILLIIVLQIRRTRYVLMVFPMVSLMAAYGLMRIKRVDLRRFIALSIVASSVVIAFFAYRPFLNMISMVNLKDAGEFVNQLPGPDIEVFTVYAGNPPANPAVAVPILDLFTNKRIYYRHNVAADKQPDDLETSSLRFTWEYRSPAYYEVRDDSGRKRSAVVVISDEISDTLPRDIKEKTITHSKRKIFVKDEKEFEFRTFVSVYYD